MAVGRLTPPSTTDRARAVGGLSRSNGGPPYQAIRHRKALHRILQAKSHLPHFRLQQAAEAPHDAPAQNAPVSVLKDRNHQECLKINIRHISIHGVSEKGADAFALEMPSNGDSKVKDIVYLRVQ